MASGALVTLHGVLNYRANPNRDRPKEKLATFWKYTLIPEMLPKVHFKSGVSRSSAYGPRQVRPMNEGGKRCCDTERRGCGWTERVCANHSPPGSPPCRNGGPALPGLCVFLR